MKPILNLPRRRCIAVGLAACFVLSGCDKKITGADSARNFQSVDITGADYGKKTALPDVHGKMRTMADFKGKVTVVFFGFTQCPDVCPTTLAELAQVKRALGPDGERLQGVFITLDPERDTAELLKAYVGSFDPGFVALRGSLEQTAAAAKDFKVFYAKVPGKEPGSYSLDHTAGSYVFDARGQLRLFARFSPGGAGVAALTADLKQLVADSKT